MVLKNVLEQEIYGKESFIVIDKMIIIMYNSIQNSNKIIKIKIINIIFYSSNKFKYNFHIKVSIVNVLRKGEKL